MSELHFTFHTLSELTTVAIRAAIYLPIPSQLLVLTTVAIGAVGAASNFNQLVIRADYHISLRYA